MATKTPEQKAKRAQQRREWLASLTPEQREQHNARNRLLYKQRRAARPLTPEEKSTNTQRQREWLASVTPEKREQIRERDRIRKRSENLTPEQLERRREIQKRSDARRRGKRATIAAQPRGEPKAQPAAAPAAPAVEIVVTLPAPKPLTEAQLLRLRRRALAESYRQPMKPPAAKLEQAHLEWAAREADRIAAEEKRRAENRALDWHLNGGAAGYGGLLS